MLAIIRISGDVNISHDIRETFRRMKLGRKYTCVILNNTTKSELGMIKKIKDYIAYGEISDEVYKKLAEKRGRKNAEGGLRPFFRLHPPRGGIDSKKHFGVAKGVLGNNREHINKLIERML